MGCYSACRLCWASTAGPLQGHLFHSRYPLANALAVLQGHHGLCCCARWWLDKPVRCWIKPLRRQVRRTKKRKAEAETCWQKKRSLWKGEGGDAAVRAPNGILLAVHHPQGTQGACPERGTPQNRGQGAQGHGHNKKQKNRAFHTVRPKSELGATKVIGGRKAAAFLPFVTHFVWAHNVARPPGWPP